MKVTDTKIKRSMRWPVALLVAALVCFSGAQNAQETSTVNGTAVPTAKQTTLGLYVTAKEAYEKWKAAPDQVKILDVRTPEEYLFVGHAEMARNIPLLFVKHEWNAEKHQPVFEPNPDFISSAKRLLTPTDTILVTCRSGGRSAMSVNALAKAGFENVYNIVDGMEGDDVDDPGSAYYGKRMRNGWKNSGAPWTYEVNPELLWISGNQ